MQCNIVTKVFVQLILRIINIWQETLFARRLAIYRFHFRIVSIKFGFIFSPGVPSNPVSNRSFDINATFLLSPIFITLVRSSIRQRNVNV